MHRSRVRKSRRVVNAELHVVLAAVEDRVPGSQQEPEAPAVFIGVATPEPKTGTAFDVESVRQPGDGTRLYSTTYHSVEIVSTALIN